jgi:hypothetical protein
MTPHHTNERTTMPTDPAMPTDPTTLGATGNERLTAWAGASLFLWIGFEGITILNIHSWLTAHMLIGIALIIPTGVKLASTGYRFARYYMNVPAYVRNGPPQIVPRVLAPFLVLNTAFILLSGVSIPLSGGYRHQVEGLHKLSFVTWIVLTGVHVLFYLKRMPPLLLADLSGRETPRGTTLQRLVVVVSGVVSRTLALVLTPWMVKRQPSVGKITVQDFRRTTKMNRQRHRRSPIIPAGRLADRSGPVGKPTNRAVHFVLGMGSNLRSRWATSTPFIDASQPGGLGSPVILRAWGSKSANTVCQGGRHHSRTVGPG